MSSYFLSFVLFLVSIHIHICTSMYSKQENFVSQVPHQFCVVTYPDVFAKLCFCQKLPWEILLWRQSWQFSFLVHYLTSLSGSSEWKVPWNFTVQTIYKELILNSLIQVYIPRKPNLLWETKILTPGMFPASFRIRLCLVLFNPRFWRTVCFLCVFLC